MIILVNTNPNLYMYDHGVKLTFLSTLYISTYMHFVFQQQNPSSVNKVSSSPIICKCESLVRKVETIVLHLCILTPWWHKLHVTYNQLQLIFSHMHASNCIRKCSKWNRVKMNPRHHCLKRSAVSRSLTGTNSCELERRKLEKRGTIPTALVVIQRYVISIYTY